MGSYRVVTTGLQDGIDRDIACSKLAGLFKRVPADVQPLLAPTDAVVKKGLDREAAGKYQQALQACGCVCRIEEEAPPASAPLAPAAVPQDARLAQLLPDVRRMEEGQASGPDDVLVVPLFADLAIAYWFHDSGEFVTNSTLAALGINQAQLQERAMANAYALVQPRIAFKQMRLAPPAGQQGPEGFNFFSYIETGDGLEAACLLLAPIWGAVGGTVKGPLRIAIPTKASCMYCGGGEEIAYLMMRDIARDIRTESSAEGLSNYIYTFDVNGNLTTFEPYPEPKPAAVTSSLIDQDSVASDPGQMSLSHDKLRWIQPELLDMSRWRDDGQRRMWLDLVTQSLSHGDTRPAVVIHAGEGIVAALTDEIDCIALLKFGAGVAQANGWQTGTRLVTVNIYIERKHGLASDLVPGPKDSGKYGNFRPLIADLVTDDLDRLSAHKARITEVEWNKAFDLGKQAFMRKVAPRDGRPLHCEAPVATVPRPEPAASTAKPGQGWSLAKVLKALGALAVLAVLLKFGMKLA